MGKSHGEGALRRAVQGRGAGLTFLGLQASRQPVLRRAPTLGAWTQMQEGSGWVHVPRGTWSGATATAMPPTASGPTLVLAEVSLSYTPT